MLVGGASAGGRCLCWWEVLVLVGGACAGDMLVVTYAVCITHPMRQRLQSVASMRSNMSADNRLSLCS